MKVHLQQIPSEGAFYEGTEPNSILDLHEKDVRALGPVEYRLDVGLSDGGLFATGRVSVDMELQCVSCLEHFAYPVRVNNFACQIPLTGAESVDLTEPVREDILLALPAHPHCDWSGEKVCHGVPAGAASLTEPAVPGEAVWGALDQLKLK